MSTSRQTKSQKAREERYSTDMQWDPYLDASLLFPSPPNTKPMSPYYCRLSPSPEPITHTEWPPSIREAAQQIRYAPSTISALYSASTPEMPRPSTPPHRTMTATPLSFYSRSLGLGFPEMQHGIDLFIDPSASPNLPKGEPHPMMDDLDETVNFVTSDYSSSSLTSGSSLPDDDPTSLSFPLQYHLLSATHSLHSHPSKDFLLYPTTPTTPHSSLQSQPNTSPDTHPLPYHHHHHHHQHPPRPRPQPHPTALTTPTTPPSTSCPLCPTLPRPRSFTGRYAARNLARHLETKHTPSASLDGVRHIPCGQPQCERTFCRADAKLDHERKSHPELGRSPAVKRKR